ncbi:MAG: hypothetical protein JW759_10460 [Candidatus Coatesbacteria bacterium]|nr:hypothetical protein [Candidatus Coatesbacteria bacterium]
MLVQSEGEHTRTGFMASFRAGSWRDARGTAPLLVAVLILPCILCGVCASQSSGGAAEEETARKEEELSVKELPVHGFYSMGARLRFTGGESDLDAFSCLGLDVGDPYRDGITAHLLARSSMDIHRVRDGKDYYLFHGIDDTYRRTATIRDGDKTYEVRQNTRLYYGYVDLHRSGYVESIRLGRQLIYDTPEVAYFDGASLLTSEFASLKSLQFCVYGGVPVHEYESSASGDSLLGAFAQAKLWPGGKAQLSFMHAEDRTESGEFEDDHLAASLWQSIGEQVSLHARYARLSDSDGDVTARVTLVEPLSDFSVQASYYQLFQEEVRSAIEFDPYCSALGELRPFWDARLLVQKGFSEHLTAEAGFEFRRLKERAEESTFNHEFVRYSATLTLADLPIEGLSLSLNGDCWDTRRPSGGDNWTVGGDIDYGIGEKLKASLGTAYSLYKYDYDTEQERDDVRTYYAGVKFWPIKMLMLGLSYDVEDDDFKLYHTLKGELKVTF